LFYQLLILINSFPYYEHLHFISVKKKDSNLGICFSRKLFGTHKEKDPDYHYPYLINDIIGVFVWFLAAGVATACGVGGGGIYVPLGIILLRFASKPATGLSQASIFGASLGGLLLNIRNQHPDTKIRDTVGEREEDGKTIPYEKDLSTAEIKASEQAYLDMGPDRKFYNRPLIDYDMALFLAPMEMAGAVMGVIIQKLLPNWLFLSLAGIILGFTALKTYKKFISAFKIDKENRERRRLAELKPDTPTDTKEEPKEPAIPTATAEEGETETKTDGEEGETEANVDTVEKSEEETTSLNVPEYEEPQEDQEKLQRRRELLEEDSRQYPKEKLFFLIILWIGLAFIIFLKGGKGVDSIIGITCSSPWYAVLIALQFLWTLGFAVIFGLKLVKRHEEKVKVDYPFHTNDVLWDASKLRFYAFFTFVAGIVAGLIGIGGGMVLGPLMLILGVHPRVSSATTATMIVLTSSSVAVMFVTSGLVPWQYAIFFFCICLSGAYIGKKYIDGYVKKSGMSSILIGILATIIGVATIGCFVIVFLNLNKANWCFDGFKAFCVDKGDKDEICALENLMNG
jgi:uncharacterized membrane protein YfcA